MKLDRLNVLVELEMTVPAYRRVVDRTGRNLAWLRKAAKSKPVSAELNELLKLDIKELIKD